MRKLSVVVSLCALAPFALAACGGGGSSSSSSPAATSTSAGGGGGGGGGETVKVSADPSGQLAFQESSLSAKAGNDTFDFTNDAPVTHDFCIEDSSGTEVGCSDTVQGGSSTLTADLKAGQYTYFCSVDSHRQAGMEGTLTVK
jgi:plastocyanin